MKKYYLLFVFYLVFVELALSQNVGIGAATPNGKLHIKGTHDTSQLVIDAFSTQTRPLVRFRSSYGNDMLHIRSDTSFNVFVGYAAGTNNDASNGFFNTFIGSNSGFYNTTGQFNTALGRASFYQNTTGERNTALGFHTLFSNINGDYNTAVGSEALNFNINGYYNTALGSQALYYNDSGSANTATGYRALYLNTIGNYNTANGFNALYYNTTGSNNTANGVYALLSNTTGYYNTANGVEALASNTTGGSNTANGVEALRSNTTGSNNTANGVAALRSTTTGYNNTANGVSALRFNTTGFNNVSIGVFADEVNVSGFDNTSVGGVAGNDGPANNSNTIIGSGAHVAAGANNCVVLGKYSYTNTNNLALLGNTTSQYCGGYVGWTTYISDGRLKREVNEDVKGLNFIMRLRPVTYHVDLKSLYDLQGVSPYGKKDSSMTVEMKVQIDESIRSKEAMRMSGFIAQEVEKAALETGYNFSGIKKPQNEKDNYGITYSDFVVPLVKAVQEQQAIIDSLQKQVEAAKGEIPVQTGQQQQKIDILEKKIAQIEKLLAEKFR